jgi:adenine-specific DNA-methyltransferase
MNNIQHSLGQYFTTNNVLKQTVFEFILNNPDNILEPSIGRGDLVLFLKNKKPNINFDMYEIDTTIKILDGIDTKNIIYCDFMKQKIVKSYKTIIGNPPYIKKRNTRNLYIDFIEKCYNLLNDNGELIFIVPSDFFKLTSASKLLNNMINNGTFTHIFHPNNEKMFENASIDVIVFRYCKNSFLDKTVLYNNKKLYITNSNGLITFDEVHNNNSIMFKDYFDIYVGIVSGKEEVYKNEELGNIEVLNGENKIEKYIYIEHYPCENENINKHLLKYKDKLMERGIRKFNENNWFEWGAPRNITTINSNLGKKCIYIYNLTRKSNIAFTDTVKYFGGNLLILIPKKNLDITKIVSYLNSNDFKDNFIFSGRFKIGHRQIANSYIPKQYISKINDTILDDENILTNKFLSLKIDEKNIIKIQKCFRGYILRLKQLPLIMYKIQNYLKSQNINISNQNEDGRINSCVDEDEIIKLLIKYFGNKIKKPKIRMWYDILAFDNIYGWIPVNIKTTNTLTSDNTGNLAMCVYSYTDELLDLYKQYDNGLMSEKLYNKLKNKNYNKNYKKDYYFLVINKKNTNDIIINSIKGLSVLTPNINNLPFQICWDKNRIFTYKNINIQIRQFINCLVKPKQSWREIFLSNIRSL